MHRVLIVEHHPLIGNGLCHILETNGYHVIGLETTGEGAISSAIKNRPELIILDLHLADLHGFDVIRVLRGITHDIRIIALTSFNCLPYQLRCQELGVKGYMLKRALTTRLIEVAGAVMNGSTLYPEPEARPADSVHFINGVRLTPKERVVLNYLVTGMSNAEIAGTLNVSHKTVSSHKCRIMEKFKAKNLIDLLSMTQIHRSTALHGQRVFER